MYIFDTFFSIFCEILAQIKGKIILLLNYSQLKVSRLGIASF